MLPFCGAVVARLPSNFGAGARHAGGDGNKAAKAALRNATMRDPRELALNHDARRRARARQPARPSPPKPISIIAQVEASGAAIGSGAPVSTS